MNLLATLAPRHSRRRLVLKVLRDFLYRPSSLAGHLSPTNFHNARVASALRIHCTVCGGTSGVAYDFPDLRIRKAHGIGVLRETLCCMKCGASMRDRQMATGLLLVTAERTGSRFQDLAALRASQQNKLRILDTDSFSALNSVLRGMQGYVHSQYLPGKKNGEQLPDGSVNLDLLEIPFPDGHFDVVMTSDVMEHVANDEQAHREIQRCLAPRGTYVFTIPYDATLQGTRYLTQRAGSAGDPFILEKHVHGDPHSASGILAHRIYGQQVMQDLRSLGFDPHFLTLDVPTQGIFGGDLFLAGKVS